jgi:hypothetical protein
MIAVLLLGTRTFNRAESRLADAESTKSLVGDGKRVHSLFYHLAHELMCPSYW